MEVPYSDFIIGDAKNHRIQYIKKIDGDIKWDRKLRINKFSVDE